MRLSEYRVNTAKTPPLTKCHKEISCEPSSRFEGSRLNTVANAMAVGDVKLRDVFFFSF